MTNRGARDRNQVNAIPWMSPMFLKEAGWVLGPGNKTSLLLASSSTRNKHLRAVDLPTFAKVLGSWKSHLGQRLSNTICLFQKQPLSQILHLHTSSIPTPPLLNMPEVNAPTQQQPMEAPTSEVVTQQPVCQLSILSPSCEESTFFPGYQNKRTLTNVSTSNLDR